MAPRDQLVVERAVEPVILLPHPAARDRWPAAPARAAAAPGRGRSPSSDRTAASTSRQSARPIISSIVRKPSSAISSRTSCAMNRKKFSTNSGVPVNFLRSSGSCVAMPDRAGVQVADAHHHAAHHDERRRGEAVLLGAEQRADDDVAAGLQLAVHLHDDAVAQLVEHEHLLRLGEPELPRQPRVLEARQRRRAGAAVMARDQHDVGMRLGDARGHRAHAALGHELHVDPRLADSSSSGRK